MSLQEKEKSVSILIVDDEFSVRDSLTKWFKSDGYLADSAANATEALKKLQSSLWDIVFLDIKMPGVDGMELQQRIKNISPDIVVIMLTGYAAIDTAVKSLKEGAYDYLTKPVDPDYLSHLVEKIIQQRRVSRENILLRERIEELNLTGEIIGESPEMLKVFELIKSVAGTNTPVLIKGEQGTGKELIARAIHAKSPRRFFPFVHLNCIALEEELLESELFGHEKGALAEAQFPRKGKLEMADGGTLFLDEPAVLSTKAQTVLQRAIETRNFSRVGNQETLRVDFRLISATSKDLETLVNQGTFSKDLYYLSNVLSISVPPLRERGSDITLLANHFLSDLAKAMDKKVTGFSPEALKLMQQYAWPGNVQELKNVIQRSVVVCQGQHINASELSLPTAAEIPAEGLSLEGAEKAHILRMLEQTGWNKEKTARVLKIDEDTLRSKIEKYGLRK